MSISLSAQNRTSLVIGNSDYETAPLRNPVNDARDVASTLINLGFNVMLFTDLNHQRMENAIRAFENSLSAGDIALFYFSGHGMQVDGINYLIPIGENIRSENEVKFNAIPADQILEKLRSAGCDINIIILDACRDNPFSFYRSGTKGFAPMNAPSGSIICYSTSPGSVAIDGTGSNSPYTDAFIETIQTPGLEIERAFRIIRESVVSQTAGEQTPWNMTSLIRDFYFAEEIYEVSNPPINQTQKSATKCVEDFSGISGFFADTRDGQEYKWVRIGEQIWMAENLNHGRFIPSSEEMSNNAIIEKYCYSNNEDNCLIYGGLYQLEEILSYSYSKKNQGICPDGWHVPNKLEWKTLIYKAGKDFAAANMIQPEHWLIKKTKASNSTRFSLLPSGHRTRKGKFEELENSCYYWTSEEGGVFIYTRFLGGYIKIAGNMSQKNGFSLRCIKD